MTSLILLGDVNLMNVDDPAVPFRRIGPELREADLVFANLECCLYRPPEGHVVEHEGFFADPRDRRRGAADRRDRRGRHRQQRQLRRGGDPRLDRRTRPARDRPYRRRSELRRGFGAGDRRIRRNADRVRAAQLGLLADQSRGDGARRRHRGAARPHGLSGPGAQDPARDPADEPARRAACRRDLGRPRLSEELHRPDRGAAPGRPISSSRRAIGGSARRCSTT